MTGQQWTIKEAAETLGVSEKTVRRRIKDGTIKAEQTQGKYGLEYRITSLEDIMPLDRGLDTDQSQSTVEFINTEKSFTVDNNLEIEGGMSKALDIIKTLQEENVKLAAQVGFLQAQLIELDKKVRLLAEPKDSRSWWQRLLWWRSKPAT